MASGNVTAMMACQMIGHPRIDGATDYNDIVYGKCSSSDNSSNNFSTGFLDARGYDRDFNYIGLADLIDQKWIFSGTSNYSWSSSSFNVNIFYKVSSD